MSVLDHCLERPNEAVPTQDEEFVLLHVDGVEATGFVSHLKLPHYVTFQSKLSSVRTTRANARAAQEPQAPSRQGTAPSPLPDGLDYLTEGGDAFYGADV
jgi:alpha-D-ribose 1-methylphosphonate 5-triphosphate synthase subunit PhnI